MVGKWRAAGVVKWQPGVYGSGSKPLAGNPIKKQLMRARTKTLERASNPSRPTHSSQALADLIGVLLFYPFHRVSFVHVNSCSKKEAHVLNALWLAGLSSLS